MKSYYDDNSATTKYAPLISEYSSTNFSYNSAAIEYTPLTSEYSSASFTYNPVATAYTQNIIWKTPPVTRQLLNMLRI